MARGSRARKKQKKTKPPPTQPDGETLDGELGPVEMDVPEAMARDLRRMALAKLMRSKIR